MKTKIIISSGSGLDYLNYDLDISTIPDRLKIHDYEKYNDTKELKLDNLYMRLRYTNEKIDVLIPDYDVIKAQIETYFDEEYERFVFLVDKNKGDYYDLIRKIKSDLSLDADILRINKTSFPLSFLAYNINKLYKENASLNTINEYIEEFNKCKILVCNPLVDKYISFDKEKDEDFNDLKSSIIYEYKNNLSQIKWNKKDNPLSFMIKNILHDVENKEFKLFILYTYSDSNYVNYLKKKIYEYHPKLEIIMLPMPLELAKTAGPFSFGIGYVIK